MLIFTLLAPKHPVYWSSTLVWNLFKSSQTSLCDISNNSEHYSTSFYIVWVSFPLCVFFYWYQNISFFTSWRWVCLPNSCDLSQWHLTWLPDFHDVQIPDNLLFSKNFLYYFLNFSKLSLCWQRVWLFGSTELFFHFVFGDSHYKGN